jgi:hypothetical protein
MMALFIIFLHAHKKSIVLTSRCATPVTFNNVFHLSVILFGNCAVVITHYGKLEKMNVTENSCLSYASTFNPPDPLHEFKGKVVWNTCTDTFVAYLLVILVKSGPAKYSFYMDLESHCVTFRHMRLFVRKLKHNAQWYLIRLCGFS